MQIHEVAPQERPAVRQLRDGRLRVGARVFPSAVLLVAGGAREWGPRSASEIDVLSLRPVLEADPAVDLLLVGTGPLRTGIPDESSIALHEAGIAHEAMATSSAVRALNALAGDAREIAFAAVPGR